ncbi:peroxiredoxin [Haloprofundus marisrubri]|uniref:Peroxiredoxin n=1 Tax=Haloprofundus marisrubri TaxID=1514971 RepID=A0A0W1RA53_9EURY|nr:OsmC family peroxiredoxin [Haloprofundus marisrubri]KTG10144.1 peroxiredoxin [Haloprofundus marisrubri]
MPVRTSEAEWEGDLRDGTGTMALGSGAYEGEYSYVSRFEEGDGTNPEELIGAAHAGCFSMALAGNLAKAGHEPDRIHTQAHVHLEDGQIARIVLEVDADVPDIDDDEFREQAEEAKQNCPVSQALSGGPTIELDASLA